MSQSRVAAMWLRKKADDEAYSAYLRNVKVANPGIHGHHHEPEISGITVKHYAEGAASNPDERRRKAWAQRELVKLRQAYEAQKAQVPSVEKIQEAIKAGPKEGTPLHELAVKLRSSPELVLQTLLSSELMATGEVHFDPSTASLVDWSHKSQKERGGYHKTRVARTLIALSQVILRGLR